MCATDCLTQPLLLPTDVAMNKIGCRLMDEVIKPMKDMQVDETEYAALKAIVFFDPGTIGAYATRTDRMPV